MPWCDECARFYDERQLAPDGRCTQCGATLARPVKTAAGGTGTDGDDGDGDGAGVTVPWHFWLLAIALAIYLGYRLIQGISWAADKL